jgi:subtilisin family serine protease
VIGVTSVDSQRRLQLDANRGNVLFAARGVDVRAATLNGDYASYTGTSFAAPVVTAHFATLVASPNVAAAHAARETLARAAERLGDRAAYGFGYVSSLSPAVQ